MFSPLILVFYEIVNFQNYLRMKTWVKSSLMTITDHGKAADFLTHRSNNLVDSGAPPVYLPLPRDMGLRLGEHKDAISGKRWGFYMVWKQRKRSFPMAGKS